jgi:DNA-binding CsgD family transcriptional regulator
MAANESRADPRLSLIEPDHVAQPLGDDPRGGSGSAAALIFDAEARLIYVSGTFAELVGVDPDSLIGSTHPFPWCKPNGSHQCRDRIQLLAGREARELGIESLSWSLFRHCGDCLRGRLGPEKMERAFKNELRDAKCFAVCDAAMMEKIREVLSPDVATPRRELEAALRRIAIEVERLGLSVMLPVRPQGVDYEDLRLLSARELEVLRPFMEGRRVASIARLLSISPHTVRNHLKSIYGKLGVRSQAELIEKLRQEIPAPRLPEMPQRSGRSG